MVNLSGRGDKDWTACLRSDGERKGDGHEPDRRDMFEALKREGRKGLVGYLTAGDPDLATSEREYP